MKSMVFVEIPQPVNAPPGLKLFHFPCCSEMIGKYYILGRILYTIKRCKKYFCRQCDKYTVCDSCIGQTNNGFFPVVKIWNKPVAHGEEDTPYYFHRDHEYSCDRPFTFEFKKRYCPNIPPFHGIDPNVYFMLDDCLSCT